MTLSESSTVSPAPSPPYHSLAILSIGVGVLLLFVSLCSFAAFLIAPFANSPTALESNTALLSFFAIALGYGALLVVMGRGLLRNQLTAPFRLPRFYWFVALFLFVLLVGQAILALNVGAAYLFPAWHVIASLLVPLAVLSFAARRLEAVSWRSVLAQFAWGGLVTIALSFIFEIIIGAVVSILALLAIVLLLGMTRVNALTAAIRSAQGDPQRIMQLLSQEPVIVLIGGSVLLALFVFIIPLLEETLKSAGPAILIARRVRSLSAPSRGTALLWGLAAGAGFAFSENMLNAQGSLGNPSSLTGLWAGAMFLRAGTSLMHMLCTATATRGWYEALAEKKFIRLPLWLLAATALHGFWNAGAFMLGGVSVFTDANRSLALMTGVLAILVLLFLLLLVVLALIWLRVVLHWARLMRVESIV
ncbi:MAG TPA: PrsW family glutamic-type intramembrane protease [Anaerolineae bacterium]|nr:PrsW family glutamic-type intramembrane protease [Anaerolineae bacterium]